MSDKKYSKACEAKASESKGDDKKKDDKPVLESTNYVTKKNNKQEESNFNGGNRRYDNSNSNGGNRRYDNSNSNGSNNRYENNNSNSNGDNRRYENNNNNSNSNGGNRRYENNNSNSNGGNRRYENNNNNNNSNSNGGNRRFDNSNSNSNGGNRRYDNSNSNSNYNGGNRRYDNSNSNYNGGNRRYDNRNRNNNINDNSNGNDNYNDNDNDNNNFDNKIEKNHYEDKTNDSEENSELENKDQESFEPKPLTAEQIAKREECIIPIETFDDLTGHIDLKIIRGVMSYGFDTPSPIQQKAIKPFLSKFDLIAQAQSGTGKTATFCIGTLGNIDFTKNETQAIILAHTMELAHQIEHVFSNIGSYIDLRLALAVKSISVRENIDLILGKNKDGLLPHVVIGTPGRMLDMILKKIIDINTVRVLVLDEADELLSEGFIKQIKQIISSINNKTQIGLFSATMDNTFFKMTEKFLRNPISILINKENLTLDGIKQYNIECEKNEYKFETLCDLYSLFSTSQTIIYCNYHQSVEILTKKMQEQNFKVSLIHGSMDIAEREEAMKKFRSLNTRVLISTDLLGRGIDVQQVSIVINYDIPFKNESYIHRIGRSGRHGRTGTAINFVTNNDVKRMDEIAKYYSTTILPLPADVSSVFQNVN